MMRLGYLVVVDQRINYNGIGISFRELIEFADFEEPAEGTTLTNAQLWSRLLRMDPIERDKFLTMMQDAAGIGRICEMMQHRERMEGISQIAAIYAAAASAQKHEAETYYNRMRKALEIAHRWRNFARNLIDYLDGKHEEETLRPIEPPR